MADKTTGDLQAVPVGDLPLAPDIYDDTLMPVEQNGEAKHMTGAQWKAYAKASVSEYVQGADASAKAAAQSETNSKTSADAAALAEQNSKKNADASALSEANAEHSAGNAAESEALAAEHKAEAEEWANKAQGYAEQATVPAVAGVYNVVLTDRITSERYALIVESGRLKLLGVADSVDATELTLIDNGNGTSFAVVVENGKLYLKEV